MIWLHISIKLSQQQEMIATEAQVLHPHFGVEAPLVP